MKTPKLVGNLGPEGVVERTKAMGKRLYGRNLEPDSGHYNDSKESRVGRAWGRALCLPLLLLIKISFLLLHYFILFPN